jgi:hypothetical protein
MPPKAKPTVGGSAPGSRTSRAPAPATGNSRSSGANTSRPVRPPATSSPPPPAAVTSPVAPPGDLGSIVQFHSASWRVVYAGPVMHRDGKHVGLELIPPSRLTATFLPAAETPPRTTPRREGEPADARPADTHPEKGLCAVAEQVSRALVLSLQKHYDGGRGATSGTPPSSSGEELSPADMDTLAVADCMRQFAAEGQWTDGVGPDGTRYFTLSSNASWAVLVPWEAVLADQKSTNASTKERVPVTVDALKSLVPADLTPARRTPPKGDGTGPPRSASSPVVGSARSLIRRQQQRASLEGNPHDAADDAQVPTLEPLRPSFVDSADAGVSIQDSARRRHSHGTESAGEPSSRSSSVRAVSVPNLLDSAPRRSESVTSLHETSTASVPAEPVLKRPGRTGSGPTTPRERVSTGTQTLSDVYFGWVPASLSRIVAEQPRPSEPSLTSEVSAETVTMDKAAVAILAALSEFRRSVTNSLAESFIAKLSPQWISMFDALESLAMQPPTTHPPLPGGLLSDDTGAHHDDAIIQDAVEAEERRDLEASMQHLMNSDSASSSGAFGRRVVEEEATLEAAETDLLRELCERDGAETDEGAPSGGTPTSATVATPPLQLRDSLHFTHLRRVARQLAETRQHVRRCTEWLPPAATRDLSATDEESDELYELYAALETATTGALRPLTSFLSRRRAHEPLLMAAEEEDDMMREAVKRLRFDAEGKAEVAKLSEIEGDIEEYERNALDRLGLLEAAQEHVVKACSSLYSPISGTLCEVPKDCLKQVTSTTARAMDTVANTIAAGIRAARQARSDGLQSLDAATSSFIRSSYERSRNAAALKKRIAALVDFQRECVAIIVDRLRQLHEACNDRSRLVADAADEFAARAAAYDEYEAVKIHWARRICHAHREVLSLRCLNTAVDSVRRGLKDVQEKEMARIMELQRTVTERTIALHELHHGVYHDLSLAAGEVSFRKGALRKRIQDRCDNVNAQLFIAQETSHDDDAKNLAIKRTELEGLLGSIDTTIHELDTIVDRSRGSFETLSRPLLLTAGREFADPSRALIDVNAERQAKIRAYITDVLQIHDAPTSTGADPAASASGTAVDTDAAIERGLQEARAAVQAGTPHTTPGYNPFHSTADPHDPVAVD